MCTVPEIEDLDLKDIRELLNLTDEEIKKQPKICSKLLNKNYVLYGDKAILDFQKSPHKWRQFLKIACDIGVYDERFYTPTLSDELITLD